MAPRPMTAEITSRYDDAGAHRMHARTCGDPRDPAVVLVHGLGLSGRYLEPLMGELDGLHVLAPDLPGIGDSDRPDRPLTVTEHADALATWIDTVGLDRPLLVGHSVGAQVAALAAERHPEQASGLVLISPNGDPLARAPLRQAARLVLDAPLERPSLIPVATVDYLRSGPWRMWRTLHGSSDIDLEAHLRRILTGPSSYEVSAICSCRATGPRRWPWLSLTARRSRSTVRRTASSTPRPRRSLRSFVGRSARELGAGSLDLGGPLSTQLFARVAVEGRLRRAAPVQDGVLEPPEEPVAPGQTSGVTRDRRRPTSGRAVHEKRRYTNDWCTN
ncbi:alpha/beta fold hydrolase [Luteipulveratus halotolerans]|uniref:alpha/beta fold hydrolase n=1 Tax=Luteipulveratus halotolerans TaxID=1631356 RepID=UPI0006805EBF|nr:alpha/beta hydrolase [Luteipulveratus halotolerans]